MSLQVDELGHKNEGKRGRSGLKNACVWHVIEIPSDLMSWPNGRAFFTEK